MKALSLLLCLGAVLLLCGWSEGESHSDLESRVSSLEQDIDDMRAEQIESDMPPAVAKMCREQRNRERYGYSKT